MDLRETILAQIPNIIHLRKVLNENAELSFDEYKTQNIISQFLTNLGFKNMTMANTGIVGILNDDEECIAVRADMDALPVNGVSHVCGHDYHMAVAMGVCSTLKALGYNKCIKFIFQPGEEGDGGAVPMINEGVLLKPNVTAMIGFHVWPEVRVGTIEVAAGPSMGSIDNFDVNFKGKGGHAAIPNKCINPIYPAMEFINSITTKSKIQIDPLNSHVLTIASINCGSANNVISDNSVVKGTVRTFDNNLRETLKNEIIKTSEHAAANHGCEAHITYDSQYPPLISDKALTDSFISITKDLIGEQNVLPLVKTFASEDFAYFAEKVPSVHFRLGISDENKGLHPLHSPFFDANDDSLFWGIYVISNFIINYK